MRATVAILAFASAIGIQGCIQTEPPTALPPITSGVDEIRVVATVGCDQPILGTGEMCSAITDPARIASVIAFVDARPNSWSTPWAGAPIHPIRLEFRKDGAHQESFGISASSFERATFLSRSASRAEVDEVLGLVDLDRSHLRFRPDDPVPH